MGSHSKGPATELPGQQLAVYCPAGKTIGIFLDLNLTDLISMEQENLRTAVLTSPNGRQRQ